MSFAKIVQSKGFKNLLTKLYGFGASVVIIGTLFKIQHWRFADFMLGVGLITESVIFFFYAFEPEIDWSLAYPELAETPEERANGLSTSGRRTRGDIGGSGNGSVALAKFDEMLEKAEITPDLLQRLGFGMKKLSDTAANMNAMVDVTSVSSKYVNTINTANESLGKLSESYLTTTRVINESGSTYKSMADSLSVIETGGKSYQHQLESLNKNLSALNAVYELQRKGADDHLKDSETLYKGIQGLMKDLSESAGDTKKYREQITKLNDNLSALNNVYGNMLSAMNFK